MRSVLGRIPPLRQLDVAELFRPDAEYTAPLDLTPYGFIPDPARLLGGTGAWRRDR